MELPSQPGQPAKERQEPLVIKLAFIQPYAAYNPDVGHLHTTFLRKQKADRLVCRVLLAWD